MFLLNPEKHYKALEILQKAEINTLFAETIAKNHLQGKIFVDCKNDPKAFYICHPYLMTFLCGEYGNPDFNKRLINYMKNATKKRKTVDWLQVFPKEWNTIIQRNLGSVLRIEDPKKSYDPAIYETLETKKLTLLFERVNFKFNVENYLASKTNFPKPNFEIKRTGAKVFEMFPGTVTPKYFWNNVEHFEKYGIGFTLFENNTPLSTSFSSCVEDNYLELGIETHPKARGRGLALQACVPLIDYCIKHNLEPLWSCHSGNIGSIKLAKKLGFVLESSTPYYRVGL